LIDGIIGHKRKVTFMAASRSPHFDEPLDLGFGEVLPPSQLGIRMPPGHNSKKLGMKP
jgi:hypothetical protein